MKRKSETYLSIASISLLGLFVMIFFSNSQSLWSDDLAQMQISLQQTLPEMIRENILRDNNPPLSHLLGFFWIRVAPYGSGWLKLPNIVFSCTATFLCGVTAEKNIGRQAAVAVAAIGTFHNGIVSLAAYTFRPYGLLYLLSACMLYFYMESRLGGESRFRHGRLWFLVASILAVYTHYFAILVCVAFFMFDIFLIARKKIKISCLYAYPAAAVSLLPWVIAVFHNSVERLQNFWPQKPAFAALFMTVYELAGNNRLTFLAAAILLIFSAAYLIFLLKKRQEEEFLKALCCFWTAAFVLLSVFIVSRYSTSITSLFVSRYFVCIVPQLLILCGFGMHFIISLLKSHSSALFYRAASCGFCAGILVLGAAWGTKLSGEEMVETERFRETADYLMQQSDIYDDRILVFNTGANSEKGWQYYLTHGGVRPGKQVLWKDMKQSDLKGIKKVYVAALHNDLDESVADMLRHEGYCETEKVDSLPVYIFEKAGE